MRILCITEDLPWPANSGYRVRLSNVIPALASLGKVDHWVPMRFERDPSLPDEGPDSKVERLRVVTNRTPRPTITRWARWFRTSSPRDVLLRDWSAARRDLQEWMQPPYDLAWFGHLDTYLGVGDLVDAPAIVDLDNLWDRWLRYRRAAVRAGGSRPGNPSVARAKLAHLADMVDERKYTRVHEQIADKVGAVLVCSELDRDRLGRDNVVVIPNAYPVPEPPAVLHPPSADGPTFMLTGSSRYLPNEDAIRWFGTEILPLIRATRPNARFRVVGEQSDTINDLAATDGIELIGPVDDIRRELEAADAVVAPLRYGGGTRVKLLEAFAHRVPAVATTVGCEGLAVVSGSQILIADDEPSFAAACIRATSDDALRTTLTEGAWGLYRASYSTEVVRGLVVDVVRRVTGSAEGTL